MSLRETCNRAAKQFGVLKHRNTLEWELQIVIVKLARPQRSLGEFICIPEISWETIYARDYSAIRKASPVKTEPRDYITLCVVYPGTLRDLDNGLWRRVLAIREHERERGYIHGNTPRACLGN